MDEYIKLLRSYLNNPKLDFGYPAMDSMLDILACFYIQQHPVDNKATQDLLHSLEPIVNSLSRKRAHRLLLTVTELCAEHERSAFLEGIRVGAKLAFELTE